MKKKIKIEFLIVTIISISILKYLSKNFLMQLSLVDIFNVIFYL